MTFARHCRIGIATVIALVAVPSDAVQTEIGFQIVEDFEALPLGSASFDFVGGDLGSLSGGAIVAATAVFPARSGVQLYTGQTLVFDIVDKVNFSWPALRVAVTGPAAVKLTAFAFDYQSLEEFEVASATAPAGSVTAALFIGDDASPQFLTRAVLSSDSAFAIDDFTLGLVYVLPGIPQPSQWLMVVVGFALTGMALRQRARPGLADSR